jgi:hypothetical protein
MLTFQFIRHICRPLERKDLYFIWILVYYKIIIIFLFYFFLVMMLSPFNPINILARFVVKTAIKLFNWPKVFNLIFTGVNSILFTSISSVGLLPTLRTVWALRRAIAIGGSGALVLLQNNPRLNPHVVNTLIPIIKPCLTDCVNNTLKFSIFHTLSMIYYIFTSLTPGILFLGRFTTGLVLSSLGILWNESLSAVFSLKYLAETVISFLEDKLDLSVPRLENNTPSITDNTPIDNTSTVDPTSEVNNTSTSLFMIGLYLVAGVTVFAGIVALDIYNPDVTSSIPGIRNILDGFYSTTVNIGSWIYS